MCSSDLICFTDGEFFVLDQYIMDNTRAFTDFFIENFEAEIIVNFLNEDESGFIILKTKYKQIISSKYKQLKRHPQEAMRLFFVACFDKLLKCQIVVGWCFDCVVFWFAVGSCARRSQGR